VSLTPLIEDIARHPKGPGDGSPKALAEGHLALVIDLAKKCPRPPGVGLEDLISEGFIGLMTAAKKYDPAKARFTTYATYWIRQAMHRYLGRSPAGAVSTPPHSRNYLLKMERGESSGSQEGIARAILRARSPISLEAGGEEGGRRLQLADPKSEPAVDREGRAELEREFRSLLDGLDPREREILGRRHREKPEHLARIARDLGISKQRVSQLEATAIGKLRGALGVEAPANSPDGGEGRGGGGVPRGWYKTCEAANVAGCSCRRFLYLARARGLEPVEEPLSGSARQFRWDPAQVRRLAESRGEGRLAADPGRAAS
jgi:RNA polymerase sigma-32 factor